MKKLLSLLVLLTSIGFLEVKSLDSFSFKLQVKTDGKIQANKVANLSVIIYNRNDNPIYVETHSGVATNSVGVIRVKIGKGTKTSSGSNFIDIEWEAGYKVGFLFNGKPVRGVDAKSGLKTIPYSILAKTSITSITAINALNVDTLRSSIANEVIVTQNLNMGSNSIKSSIINIDSLNADSATINKALEVANNMHVNENKTTINGDETNINNAVKTEITTKELNINANDKTNITTNELFITVTDSVVFKGRVIMLDSIDMSKNRIQNLDNPVDSLDAVNLKTLQNSLDNFVIPSYTDTTFTTAKINPESDSIVTPYAIKTFVIQAVEIYDDWE